MQALNNILQNNNYNSKQISARVPEAKVASRGGVVEDEDFLRDEYF